MARETLLSKVPVPEGNIFRIPAENTDHDRAAEEYEATLRNFFLRVAPKSSTAPLPSVPRFDLVFLGMGPDGHTASLFPHTAALHANDRVVVANYVEKLDSYRITLTAGTINNARNVTFVVAGDDKAESLKQVLEGSDQPESYPSQLICPQNGSLLWMVDEAAARLLSGQIIEKETNR
jgi:6-phosphogluconolactonase